MSPTESTLEELASRGREGDRAAVEQLVEHIQHRVYGLALRMLWHPEDARDASQEILMRVVTHLGGYRGESAFTTWVYRIAANYLLNARKQRAERAEMSFDDFGHDLTEGLAEPPTDLGVEEHLLLEEVKIGCTHAMLLCLDRPHRLAFILGEIFELDHKEGAAVLGIKTAAFRKRVSRARELLVEFTREHCGIVNPDNRCRCRKRVRAAVRKGRLNPDDLSFTKKSESPDRFHNIVVKIQSLESGRRTVALYRSHPAGEYPENFTAAVRNLMDRF